MKTTLKLFTLLLLVTALAFSQGTLLSSTTLSAAVTTGANQITLASGTNVTIPGNANQINTVAYVDHELMRVTGLVSGTTYTVQRAQGGTRQHSHNSGAKVWLGVPTGNFLANSPIEAEAAGGCTATASPTLPMIYVKSAHFYDCLGSPGQWTLVSSPDFPQVGATVASPAGVLTPTGTIFIVSGTNAITGITVPKGMASGMTITLIPTGAFTTTTATNVAIASTAVVGKALIMTWNDVSGKWYPSY